MNIRSYQPGDEAVQAAIYNEAAAELPKFKPATVDEVRRRCQDPDFDPTTRFFAEEGGQVVGYATFHPNGRVSYPWCRKGHESLAEPLFQSVLQAMTGRGLRTAFAAYRGDWSTQTAFFQAHGFRLAREMVNFVLDLTDMPTPADTAITVFPLQGEDIPAVRDLAPEALRTTSPAELERHFFQNPYFSSAAVFVRRSRDEVPLAIGILVQNPVYANPKQVDAAMPCFRLGAFGTEGMQTKRINGLFSFLTGKDRDVASLALDLMDYAASLLEKTEAKSLAAQVPSDVPHLLRWYQQYFQRQGSFPVFERNL